MDGDEAGTAAGSISILGTAHISQASVEEVHETIDREQPDVVAVELDEGRYRQLKGGTPDDIEAGDLLSGNTVFQFLAYWMLSYVQSTLGERFDIEPGADMRAAIEAAERNGLGVALVDRDIQVTIQRFWRRLTFGEKCKVIGGVALGVTDPRIMGVTFGVGIGLMFGLLVALFLAPLLGFESALLLGLGGSASLAWIGAAGVGIGGGLLLGFLLFPSLEGLADRTGSPVGGVGLRLLAGVAIGVAATGAVVWSGTGIGPLTVGSLESAGSLTVRGGIGGGIGAAVGATAGFAIGSVIAHLTVDLEDIDEIDIEEMTDGDVVAAMLEEFRRFSPRGASALIDERDAYIAHQLLGLAAQGNDVVAVVGAGHKAGIERHLADPSTIPDIEAISTTASQRRFSIAKAFGYLVMVGFLGFFFLLIMAGVQNTFLLQLFVAWFLFNGAFAFTLARLAGARWTSAGVGGAVAWLTSINPLLAPGWFAGYVELRHRPVNVTDIQTLNDIVGNTDRPIGEAIKEMFDVPLFRLIMIVALTNVGSMIGTLLFPFVVLPWLAPEVGGIDGLASELMQGARNSLELLRGLLP